MSFNMYFGLVNVATVVAAVLVYRFLVAYHRHVLGTRLTGRWNVFTHTFLALVCSIEATHAVHYYWGAVYPVFDFLLLLNLLFAAAFTITLYRLYKGISLK